MNKKSILTSFILLTIIALWINKSNSPKIIGFLPTPTEFDLKKSKRKDFKNQRKEYIRNMHRSHPDVDWEKMNEENRKIRTNKVREIRQSLLNNTKNINNNRIENINRNLNATYRNKSYIKIS